MKKFLAVLLSAVFVCSTLSACSNEKTKPDAGGTNVSTGEEKTPESVDLKIYRPIFSEKSPSDTVTEKKWLEMMEAHLDTKLNITWEEIAYTDYMNKMQIYLAAGEWADIFTFMVEKDLQQLSEFGQTKKFLCLDDYPDLTPNYTKFMDTKGSDGIPQRQNVQTPDKKLYSFGGVSISNMQGTQVCFGANFDAFTKNNIAIPTTLDEVYTAAKKFKEIYPKSYPVSAVGGDFLLAMYNTNNTSNEIYYDGEKYAFGPTDGKLQELVAYMQKLYKEGLLDPEYATQTYESLFEKALNDKAFIAPWLYTLMLSDNINSAKKEGSTWGIIPTPKGTSGNTPWLVWAQKEGVSSDYWTSSVINSQTKHPDLAVKMLDYQYSEEMIRLFDWGVEGVAYSMVDGKPQYTDEILQSDNIMQKMAEYGITASMSVRSGMFPQPATTDTFFQTYAKIPTWMDGKEGKKMNGWEFYDTTSSKGLTTRSPIAPPMVLNEEETQMKSDIMTPVKTFVDENIAKFIAGERDMGQWDSFVTEIKKYGDYQKVLDMYNQKVSELK